MFIDHLLREMDLHDWRRTGTWDYNDFTACLNFCEAPRPCMTSILLQSILVLKCLWLSCRQVQRTRPCSDRRPMELKVEQATAGQSCPDQSSHLWWRCCRISACLAERSSSSCSYLTACRAERLDRRSLTLLPGVRQRNLPRGKTRLKTRGLHIYKHRSVNSINTKTVMLP